MIDFRNAFIKATAFNNEIEFYKEYENAYVFGVTEDDENSIVILKDTDYCGTLSDVVASEFADVLDDAKFLSAGNSIERVHSEQSPTHSARYLLEHRLLPSFLYEKGLAFMMLLAREKTFLFDLFNNILEKEGLDNPYNEEQFKVMPCGFNNVLFTRIVLPEPEEAPLCYETFAVFDPQNECADYFAVEKGEVEGEDFLCGWTEEGRHINYGQIPNEFDKIMDAILQILENKDNAPKVQASYNPGDGSVTGYIQRDDEITQ